MKAPRARARGALFFTTLRHAAATGGTFLREGSQNAARDAGIGRRRAARRRVFTMRVIPQPDTGPVRPEAAPHLRNGPAPIRFIREAVRNSPWIVIAATAHIIGIAALSVVYVKSHEKTEIDTATGLRITNAKPVEEDVPAEASELVRPEVPEPKNPIVEGPATH